MAPKQATGAATAGTAAAERAAGAVAGAADRVGVSPEPHLAVRPKVSLEEQKKALRDGRILGFRCGACGHQQVSPLVRCPKCRSDDVAAREFSTTGAVVSYTIQSVASEQFLNETPFAFAIIQLDDGPRVSGWIPWIARATELPIGAKVRYTPSYKPGMQFEKL